jgi:hypothetical protein
LPDEYAARTSPMPPVASTTPVSRQRISSCVPSRLTSLMQASASSGRPAASAARVITLAVSRMQRRAEG